MINDARARPETSDADVSDADVSDRDVPAAGDGRSDETADATAVGTAGETVGSEPAVTGRRKRKAVRATEGRVEERVEGRVEEAETASTRGERARRRPSFLLVPVLASLLALLLAAGAFLWFTRAEPSSVTTEDYVEALQAARSNVVDFTSFDHLTLDDDIEQVRRVTVGDLRDEAVERLESSRQQITDSEAIVSTEVIDAGVTRADAEEATVLLIIQTTRETNASEQAEVVKYRIEVQMQKSGDRWVLSAIRGA